MPTTCKVHIEPGQENREHVLEIILKYLGPNSRRESERLVKEGGKVMDDLNREAAENIKRHLEEAGAEAWVVSTGKTEDDSRPHALNGRVRGIESEEPVAGATVVIQPPTPEVDATLGEATTNEDGTFRMDRFGILVREYFPENPLEMQVTVKRQGQEEAT